MSETAERFRQSVAEVRQMASEVQRQLDATRQELRRGVFELPEETNEAANAMRRVVSDQIKALKELTAVVTASGADFDVSEPAAASARIEAPRNGARRRKSSTQRATTSPPAHRRAGRRRTGATRRPAPADARARRLRAPRRRRSSRSRLRPPNATSPDGCRTFLRPLRATRRRTRRAARECGQ